MTPDATNEPRFAPHSVDVWGLFEESPFFTDPYQRDYAWEADEVDDFIADIKRLLDHRLAGEDRVHFFGAVVAISRKKRLRDPDRDYEIIDGQQRMTTLSMLEAVMIHATRDFDMDDSDIEEGQETLQEFVLNREYNFIERTVQNKETRQPEPTRVFCMVDRDDEFYESLVRNGPSDERPSARASHGLLYDAYLKLREELVRPILVRCANPVERYRMLVELARAVERDTELIFIHTESHARAMQLFSVLNDRGRMLEEADLLRAHTLMLTAGDGTKRRRERQDAVAKAWDTIDRMPRTAVDAFLRHYYASFHGQRVSKAKLVRAYKRDLFRDGEDVLDAHGADAVVTAMADIADSAEHFEALERGEWPFKESGPSRSQTPRHVRSQIYRITRLLNSERSKPLLLSAASRGREFLADFVVAFEALEFRALVTGVEQNKMANLYFDVAGLIRWQLVDCEKAISELAAWVNRWAPDDALKAELPVKLNYTTHANRQLVKFALTDLEDCLPSLQRGDADLKRGSLRYWEFGQIDIEHVYPQKPEDEDLDPMMAEHVHDLGNLTLMSPRDNRDASNKAPTSEEKRAQYRKAELAVTREITKTLDDAGWGPDQVAQRRALLADRLVRVYTIDPSQMVSLRGVPNRRLLSAQRPRRDPLTWLVLSDKDGSCRHISGKNTRLVLSSMFGKDIRVGDHVVVYQRKGDDYLIKGLGIIGSVRLDDDRDRRVATYEDDEFTEVDKVALDEPVGSDPRETKSSPINVAPVGFLDALIDHVES